LATVPITKGSVIFHEADVGEEHYSRDAAVAMLRQLPVAKRRRMLHQSYGSERAGSAVFSWCHDTAALFNHSRSPNFAPDGPCGEPATVWRATRDIEEGLELVFNYDVFTEGGEGEWFAELFAVLLDGEAYPDHRQWSTSLGEVDEPIALTEPNERGPRPERPDGRIEPAPEANPAGLPAAAPSMPAPPPAGPAAAGADGGTAEEEQNEGALSSKEDARARGRRHV
jgi:hypothetical protein